MVTKTISLEEISKRASVLTRRIREEIDKPNDQRIKDYEKTHKKPFWPFGKERRKYEEGLWEILIDYSNHPLVKELETIQEQCPHDYEFKVSREDGECSICHFRYIRGSPDGGTGLG